MLGPNLGCTPLVGGACPFFWVLFSGLITLIISVIIVAPITANMAREIEGMFDSGEAAPAIESSKGGF